MNSQYAGMKNFASAHGTEWRPMNARQHSRRNRAALRDVQPRNFTPVTLICFLLVVAISAWAVFAWWNAGAVAETYARVAVAPDSGLNVRQGPGMEYQACGRLANGIRLLMLDIQNGWVLVAWPKYPEHPMGWVCGAYLEVLR